MHNARLAQALADQQAARDKQPLLSPNRPRLLPAWFWPALCLALAFIVALH